MPISIKRILSKINIRSENDCWDWNKSIDKNGYGRFSWREKGKLKTTSAHRAIYIALNGEISGKICVLHQCDNRRCCNPKHLWLGTNNDNSKDMVAKNRQAKGNRHWSRTHPEKLARGHKNGHYTHPEKTPRGDNSGPRKHPERMARGENNGYAKLSSEQVIEIKKIYNTANYTMAKLAKKYSVGKTTIFRIVNNKTWKHLLR